MGILPGGGSALMWVANNMENFTKMTTGAQILRDAMRAPFLRICENCGVDGKDYGFMAGFGWGYNLIDPENIEHVDMFKVGIVDPLKVTINALQNAVSAAGNIVSAAAAVTLDYDSPEDTSRIPVVR
jgi:chaperonin GroEL